MDGHLIGRDTRLQFIKRLLKPQAEVEIESMIFTMDGRRYTYDDDMTRPLDIGPADEPTEAHDRTDDPRSYQDSVIGSSMNNL